MSEQFADEVAVLAHRVAREVKVCGDTRVVRIRPWVMSQRAELKPKIAAVLEKVQASKGDLSLASMMIEAEEEIVAVAKACAEMPDDLEWGDLLWEDLPSIVQAIWETSIITNAGGGLAGKALALIAGMTRSVAVREQVVEAVAKRNAKDPNSQPPKIAAVPNSPGSPS